MISCNKQSELVHKLKLTDHFSIKQPLQFARLVARYTAYENSFSITGELKNDTTKMEIDLRKVKKLSICMRIHEDPY